MDTGVSLCLHCVDDSTFLDLAATAASVYLMGMLAFVLAASVRPLRSVLGRLEPFAASIGVPITVGLLAGVLGELPAYVPAGFAAAAIAMPLGMLAIADLGETWRPDAALDLSTPRRLAKRSVDSRPTSTATSGRAYPREQPSW